MSSDPNQGSAGRSFDSELVIPVLAMAFAVYYVVSIWNLPWEAQMNGFFLSAAIWVLGLLFVVRVIRRSLAEHGRFGFETIIGSGPLVVRRLGLVGLTVGYVIVIPWLGFTLTTMVFLAAAMAHLGVRSWKQLAGVSLTLSLIGYVVFIVALNSRLPRGPFEHLLAPIAALVS